MLRPDRWPLGYALYRVRPGTVRKVRQFARDNEASVNDVFLAALCRAMAPFLPRRSSKAGAHDMTLGTIVDTRADASEDLSESLGTFLGYYLVRVAGDGKVGLDELTRRIAAATRVKKQRRSYLDSAVNLRVASAIWPHLKPESRLHFARRALPLTAGISNVHLRGTWIERQGAGRILDFHRAVSNGPALPLVISPTTIRDQMNIAVSYRVTGFSQSKIDGIMQSFVEQLETLGGQVETRRPASSTPSHVCRVRIACQSLSIFSFIYRRWTGRDSCGRHPHSQEAAIWLLPRLFGRLKGLAPRLVLVRDSVISDCTRTENIAKGPVAQWLEQGTHNPLVGGSTPPGPTFLTPCRY